MPLSDYVPAVMGKITHPYSVLDQGKVVVLPPGMWWQMKLEGQTVKLGLSQVEAEYYPAYQWYTVYGKLALYVGGAVDSLSFQFNITPEVMKDQNWTKDTLINLEVSEISPAGAGSLHLTLDMEGAKIFADKMALTEAQKAGVPAGWPSYLQPDDMITKPPDNTYKDYKKLMEENAKVGLKTPPLPSAFMEKALKGWGAPKSKAGPFDVAALAPGTKVKFLDPEPSPFDVSIPNPFPEGKEIPYVEGPFKVDWADPKNNFEKGEAVVKPKGLPITKKEPAPPPDPYARFFDE